jgi:hypothetical protein
VLALSRGQSFFARLIVPDKETVQRRLADGDALSCKGIPKFEQGAVLVFLKPRLDRVGVGFGFVRMTVSTQRTGSNMALTDLQVSPPAHAGRTDAKALGSLPVRRSGRDGGKNTCAKINGKGFRHYLPTSIGR